LETTAVTVKSDYNGVNNAADAHVAAKSMNDASIWRPLKAWLAHERPGLWSWLEDPGSLTEKMRAAAGSAFHVRVLYEGQTLLDVEDAGLLHAVPGTSVRKRQVYLCADTPWVYARTLALTQSGHWLNGLGSQPLGDRVFAGSDTRRSLIEVAQLDQQHELYQASVDGQDMAPPLLWARRSILMVRGNPLLIYECFLPGMKT
jgi:chorismate lyase